jgi:hypothetical protein
MHLFSSICCTLHGQYPPVSFNPSFIILATFSSGLVTIFMGGSFLLEDIITKNTEKSRDFSVFFEEKEKIIQ